MGGEETVGGARRFRPKCRSCGAAGPLAGLSRLRKCLTLRVYWRDGVYSGTGASRADQGVRPTHWAAFQLLGESACPTH